MNVVEPRARSQDPSQPTPMLLIVVGTISDCLLWLPRCYSMANPLTILRLLYAKRHLVDRGRVESLEKYNVALCSTYG